MRTLPGCVLKRVTGAYLGGRLLYICVEFFLTTPPRNLHECNLVQAINNVILFCIILVVRMFDELAFT